MKAILHTPPKPSDPIKQKTGEGCPEATCSASSWLPIETAPKDKIEILAWSKRHGINVGILTHYKRPEMPSRKGGWFLPTHWMPLPSLPNAKHIRPEPTSQDNE
jgi:hypothetical protein